MFYGRKPRVTSIETTWLASQSDADGAAGVVSNCSRSSRRAKTRKPRQLFRETINDFSVVSNSGFSSTNPPLSWNQSANFCQKISVFRRSASVYELNGKPHEVNSLRVWSTFPAVKATFLDSLRRISSVARTLHQSDGAGVLQAETHSVDPCYE